MDDFLKPSLLPKVADPLWFYVDRPCDDDVELTKLEEEHKQWLLAIADKDSSVLPIGKTTLPTQEEEEQEDDDGDVDDVSDSDNDDELDTDMIDERDSGDEVEVDMNGTNTSVGSPHWVLR